MCVCLCMCVCVCVCVCVCGGGGALAKLTQKWGTRLTGSYEDVIILGLLIFAVWDETDLCDRQSAGCGVIITQTVQHLIAASPEDLHTGICGRVHVSMFF